MTNTAAMIIASTSLFSTGHWIGGTVLAVFAVLARLGESR